MGRVSVHVVVVQAEEETTLPSVFDGLEDGRVSEVISDVADAILEAPVGGSSVVSRNGLMKCCAVIGIVFEVYLPASEVLCEGDVHGAEFV
jgi:hypothetical protein